MKSTLFTVDYQTLSDLTYLADFILCGYSASAIEAQSLSGKLSLFPLYGICTNYSPEIESILSSSLNDLLLAIHVTI